MSEKDLVVALLTADHGVVRAAVKGARGKTKRAAALQLLTEVAVTYFRREGADLARVDSLEILESSFPLTGRIETALLLPYMAESALTFVPEAELGGDVYRLVRHVLDALGAGAPADLAARYFEVWLLKFAGLLPEESVCAACGEPLAAGDVRLDPQIPGFVSRECAGREMLAVPAAARTLLRSIRRSRLTAWLDAGATRPREPELSAVDELAREVRRRFLGHELKSYRFLKSLS